MKILISAPTGFNTREILIPLKGLLEADANIDNIFVLTPAANFRAELFYEYGTKFEFIANPKGQAAHDALIKSLAPDVIVTPTMGLDITDVPVLRAGQSNLVPTLTFIASWDNVYKIERCLKFGQPIVVPDYVAVWNRAMRDHFLRLFPNFALDKIIITGAPRFDFFSHADKIPSRAALFNFIGAPDDAKLIHCATTELYPFDYVIKDLHQIFAADEERICLYASVHPGGDMRRHESYKRYGTLVQYSFGRRDSVPLPEFRYMPTLDEIYMHIALFKHAAILVNQSSTVAIESMRADVPVINVKYGRPWDFWRWHRSMVRRDFTEHYRDIVSGGGTSIVGNRRALKDATHGYLADPGIKRSERQATTEKLLAVTDGSASRRLLDYIKKIATT